ncbi:MULTISPECIES: Xaa-Pro peptidase family protein [unclassified Pseudovibrio]|uniref:M24 family metallopeptidase n=1 Tax=unclassified Pseudovibrio TaxID=2627060 RepID=UPI0007B2E5A9|nr:MULTISPECIES: Xaa-Pro peptidase family protein [unclassified Pseudovibrio]KZL03148.1 Xaa-Pro dipeptidase [Pseudovibrio sp. W74]KZL04834.1 Xaa-Pro dipeptidase [Pseudovibrio sp. Ad14]
MALHFAPEEFAERRVALDAKLKERHLDCLLIFAQESMYWLTGFDTFGYCFFQCLIYRPGEEPILLTRSADLRQARNTSNLKDIRLWMDVAGKSPVGQVKELLFDLDLLGTRIGVEYDTHGLTAANGRLLDESLHSFADVDDASDIIKELRLVKSSTELEYVRTAGKLADTAFLAGMEEIKPGADEGRILAKMQSAVFEGGGDYPANEFVIGSGPDALLCRYKSGRRTLSENDQLTIEWAGVYRHYHAASIRTVILGEPTPRHLELHRAAKDALLAVEQAMQVGNTFGDLFAAHASILDDRGLMPHRLNACGYSLGARFTPSWMEPPYMAFKENAHEIHENMVLFMHMIIMDSDSETAMTLGQTYITHADGPESLSQLSLDLPVKAG